MALSAALIILSAITVVVLTSLNQSVSSKNQALATQYAQEGMELLKGKTDALNLTTYDLGESGTPIEGSCTETNLVTFRRCVVLESAPASCNTLRKITVTVSWTDSKCGSGIFCHSVPLTTCL